MIFVFKDNMFVILSINNSCEFRNMAKISQQLAAWIYFFNSCLVRVIILLEQDFN